MLNVVKRKSKKKKQRKNLKMQSINMCWRKGAPLKDCFCLLNFCFPSGPRSISSADEVCALHKRWEVCAAERSVRRGWSHT